jgi:hypothetical protein
MFSSMKLHQIINRIRGKYSQFDLNKVKLKFSSTTPLLYYFTGHGYINFRSLEEIIISS